MMSAECRDRLANFKFGQAAGCLDGATDEERDVVFALAYTLGDSGWIDGKMGVIAWAALRSLGIDPFAGQSGRDPE